MKPIVEHTETAPVATSTETKATKKAAAGERRANVAPVKAKAGEEGHRQEERAQKCPKRAPRGK